eukprot:1628914-Rhodomonas_salina.2
MRSVPTPISVPARYQDQGTYEVPRLIQRTDLLVCCAAALDGVCYPMRDGPETAQFAIQRPYRGRWGSAREVLIHIFHDNNIVFHICGKSKATAGDLQPATAGLRQQHAY